MSRSPTLTSRLARPLLPSILAAALAVPAWAAWADDHPSFAAPPAVAAPAWAGAYRWSLKMKGQTEPPFRLRLGFMALPDGEWSTTGSLLLDDAELGAHGSARLRAGKLVIDLIVSGGVRDVPPDPAKQALFPPGHVPERISSAGFATMRIELDPGRLDGIASMYMTNVVDGNRVQGPFYMDGTLTLDRK
ncbi:hypothetical protein [Achromobacter aloeverae]